MFYKISIFNFHRFKVFLEMAQYFTIANKTKKVLSKYFHVNGQINFKM